MFSHHLRGGGWQNLPEATEEGGSGGSEPGRPCPRSLCGGGAEGQRAGLLPPGQSASPLAEGTAGTFILANIVLKHLVFGMSGV